MALKKITDLLLEEKILDEKKLAELKSIAEKEKKTIEEVLVEKRIVDEEKITELKAESLNMSYKNLLEEEVAKDALEIISQEVAENYKVLCFNKKGSELSIGIVDPNDFKAKEAINFFAKGEGFVVKYYLISYSSFKKVLNQYQSLTEEVGLALEARKKEEEKEKKEIKKTGEETEEISKAAPVSKIVSVIIKHAVEGKASDIHIEPYKNESRVRYRIDGVLHTSLVLPLSVHGAVVARIKVLANLKLDETRIPQDGRIRLTVVGKRIDFRVSVLPLVDTEKVVMRVLDVSRGAPKLTALGYERRNLEVISENIKKTDGMLLVTGPTGSGKSTTIFSILNMINKEGVNISTLEDPVEYFLDGANQSQTRSEIGFTFAAGLRALLRQDPDVIMVGEIRDNETAELAIHAALTGHLVLSTLHTNDSIGAIPRLIDMKAEPFLLSSTLNAIIAQRLVRRICTHCKIEEKITEEVKNELVEEMKPVYDIVEDEIKKLLEGTILSEGEESKKTYKGKGCARCGGTGYSGRLSITEVLNIDDEIKSMIAEKKEIKYGSDILKKQRFISVKQDGIVRALQGITSIEEVLRVMSD